MMDLTLLQATDWTLITLGSLIAFIGLGLFYCALKLPQRRIILLMSAGMLMALAYSPWILSTETDRSLAGAIALLMTALLSFIGFACWRHIRSRAAITDFQWQDRPRTELSL